jgi:membrane-associated phospholipid phosphatase
MDIERALGETSTVPAVSKALAHIGQLALALDRAALVSARTRLHGARAERVTAGYSRLGEHGACWLALGGAGALLDRRPEHRERWLRGVRIVLAAYGVNYLVKMAVHRRRPVLPGLPPLTGTVSRLSFPSAHATTSFAAARAFCGLVSPGTVYGPAVAFALTRPYLGVHYPSDVAAGALLGTAMAAAWPQPSTRASAAHFGASARRTSTPAPRSRTRGGPAATERLR